MPSTMLDTDVPQWTAHLAFEGQTETGPGDFYLSHPNGCVSIVLRILCQREYQLMVMTFFIFLFSVASLLLSSSDVSS